MRQKGVHAIVETASPFLHQEIEAAAVLVGKKDRLASVTAENDVVESTGEMNARLTCHVGKIAESVNLSASKPDPHLTDPHLTCKTPCPFGKPAYLAGIVCAMMWRDGFVAALTQQAGTIPFSL
jgi:hypothetical protein